MMPILVLLQPRPHNDCTTQTKKANNRNAPHPNKTRKTTQTQKPNHSTTQTWDEKTQGDPIPTKKTNKRKTAKQTAAINDLVFNNKPATADKTLIY
jgi:hypothetical protein